MDKEMIPKFASKDEELDYWKSQALKYKKRWVRYKFIFPLVSGYGYSVKLMGGLSVISDPRGLQLFSSSAVVNC